MDVRFHLPLVGFHLDTYNLRYDQNTTQRSTRSCNLPRHRKTNFSTTFCSD